MNIVDEEYATKWRAMKAKNPNARIVKPRSEALKFAADDDTYYYILGEFYRANIPIKNQMRRNNAIRNESGADSGICQGTGI